MRWITLLAAIFLFSGKTQAGQFFYWANFDKPLNLAGKPPAVGMGMLTPSSIVFGSPLVVHSFEQLRNQPLLFKAQGYQQIQFDLNMGAPDYFIDFDFVSHNLNPSKFAFATIFDCPGVETFTLHGLGNIEFPDYSFLSGGWTDDQLHHLHIEMNMANQTWKLGFDHEPENSGAFNFFSPAGPDVVSLRLNLSTWYYNTPDNPNVEIAIDHVHIGTTAPAPSPTIICPQPLTIKRADIGRVTVQVQDSSTEPLQIVWLVDGSACRTNIFQAGTAITPADVTLVKCFALGRHTVTVIASNGESTPTSCATTVTVLGSVRH